MARICRYGPAGPQALRRRARAGPLPTVRRHHETIEHTADIGLGASAADLPSLFEEGALALAEAMAELPAPVARGAGQEHGEPIELEADDLVGLAFAWLNELIGRAGAYGEALAGAEVAGIAETSDGGWRLRGRARLTRYEEGNGRHGTVRARHDVKSATYHRLSVRRQRGGWSMTAYLDV